MNPWLIELVKDANERLLTEKEVERVIVYFDSLPQRIRLGEELEKLEPEMVTQVTKELQEQFPERPGYTRLVIQDLVESLRQVFVAIFVDEPEFLRRRWIDHLKSILAFHDLGDEWALDVYRAIDKRVTKQLKGASLELYRPMMDVLLESFEVLQTA